ncbi:MAG TPA: TonB-dependent receptor [Acidobacteriaceae bacterium]
MRRLALLCGVLVLTGTLGAQEPESYSVHGTITTPQGMPVANAAIMAGATLLRADKAGNFDLRVAPGNQHLRVEAPGYKIVSLDLDVEEDRRLDVQMQPSDNVTVTAIPDILEPDPSAEAYAREDLLDANPGRPGLPFSIPGFPVETASGGIKAPQYFAPGVAGDHGEPIAQFFEVGGFLFQNNLTANAHGNGYADPNVVIPAAIGGVLVDNAAFNARYGDHSINLAVTYTVRSRVEPFLSLTTDGRDADFAAGWSPRDPARKAWMAVEGSWGNGFLARPEERQQYKWNGYRAWTPGRHELTLFGVGYYGFSRIPGLIPLDIPVPDDTIDLRQQDLTHTSLEVLTDRWAATSRNLLQSSGYFRTYSLGLQSDFGDGLLRQSEFRTVAGANETYTHALNARWSLLGALDYRRDAPRNLDLKHVDADGVLQPVTSNDLTITDLAPLVALSGRVHRDLQVYLGLRRDEIHFTNVDHLSPADSYTQWPGTTSPKLSLTLGHPDAAVLPQIALSFGKAFHANDPRIGSGTARGALIIQSREYQLVATKLIEDTEVRVTVAHQTNSEELAKIDPDTGLQQDVGPSVNRYITVSARRRFAYGSMQASYSQANATERVLRAPVPEAPRLIVDSLAVLDRLPWRLTGKAEYEYVGEKPLGDGFHAVPVQEIRLSLQKAFADGRWTASATGELASGASGQTLETFALPGETAPSERIAGVPLRSYASASLVYHFRR